MNWSLWYRAYMHSVYLLCCDVTRICFPGYRMCICHLPCRPVKPNLVGDQVKMLNRRNMLPWKAGGNGWFRATFAIYLVSKYVLLSSVGYQKLISPVYKYVIYYLWVVQCSFISLILVYKTLSRFGVNSSSVWKGERIHSAWKWMLLGSFPVC